MKYPSNNLDIPIEKLKGVSSKIIKPLKNLEINTVHDLLWHLPARYDDFSQITEIASLHPGMTATVRARINSVENKRTWKAGMILTNALVSDQTGSIATIWFNQPFITQNLKIGLSVNLSGKIVMEDGMMIMQNPAYEITGGKEETIHTGRLVPVYKETRGITSRWLRYLVSNALPIATQVDDILPSEIARRQKLMPLATAIKSIHFPKTAGEARLAKKRLAFDELFLIQLILLKTRSEIKASPTPKIQMDIEAIKRLLSGLPFTLTDAQRKSAWEILKDMEKGTPMNRLLEGDVGSGKTAVAAIASLNASLAGWQTAIMAPTEILAHQHFTTFVKIMANENISICLLTGKTATVFDPEIRTEYHPKKTEVIKMIASGKIAIAIGTHSLIQENIAFKNPGLIVLDEQHRFGVNQRRALVRGTCETENKSSTFQNTPQLATRMNGLMQSSCGTQCPDRKVLDKPRLIPHLLSMTATPIPRSLALTIYGDLDISILDEMPADRKKIITKIIAPENRNDAYLFVKEEIQKGRQAFVICPRIDPSEQNNENISRLEANKLEMKSVKEEYDKLSKHIFPELNIAMIHGKIKPKEKEKIMREFKEKRSDILVSTSVIEVGIDIPNASVMIIESAERFGLAQLHQFRGRVGRSEHQSYCLLFSELENTGANQRLQALLKCNNGFELAEKDLQIRGPGDFIGTKQSGLPDLIIASLGNTELIKSARDEAQQLIKTDSQLLRHPKLKERLREMTAKIHFE